MSIFAILDNDEFLELGVAKQIVRSLIPIRVESIFEEMTKHTEKSEKLACLAAKASSQFMSIETKIEELEGAIYYHGRHQIPKISEHELAAIVKVDQDILGLRAMLADALGVKVYVNAQVREFENRQNLLINLRKMMDAEALPR